MSPTKRPPRPPAPAGGNGAAPSHYLPAFAPSLGALQLSVCRRWVDPATHAAVPTCPECQAIIQDEDDAIAVLRTEAGLPPDPPSPLSVSTAKAARDAERHLLEQQCGIRIAEDGTITLPCRKAGKAQREPLR